MEKINIHGLNIFYRKEGDSNRKLFILHGWGIDSTYFNELQDNLSSSFEVYNIDLPGFGKSDQPKSAFSVGDYMNVVSAIQEKLKFPKIYLFGHSFGGRITIKFASNNPEKLNGIILCASAGIKPKNSLKKLIFLIIAKSGKALTSMPGLNRFETKMKKLLYRVARSSDYSKLSNKILQETFKKVTQEDLKPLLKKIKLPTLLLWGEDDKLTPLRDAKIMEQEISGSKLKIYSQIGHRLPYAEAKAVAKDIIDNFPKTTND